MIAQGCIGDPDQPRPDCACTIRTRRQAVHRNVHAHSLSARKSSAQNLSSRSSSSRSSSFQTRKQNSATHIPGYSAGNDGWNSVDSVDDEFAPLRSMQMQIAMHSRQRLYAYCLPSCCSGDKDRHAIKGRVIRDDHSAAASTMGFRGTSGPTALDGRDVARMWQRNAAITMRYAVMHGTSPCAFQALKADKCGAYI
jgi:hypothetical protein